MKIIILVNPSAGQGKARRVLKEAVEGLRRGGVEPQVCQSTSPEHLLQLAREARMEKPDVVVSAGGDGTAHYVLNSRLASSGRNERDVVFAQKLGDEPS